MSTHAKALCGLLLTAVLLLSPAAAGYAKGVQKAELCGASGCAPVSGTADELMRLAEGAGPAAAPRPAAWYRLRLTIGPEGVEDFDPVVLRNAYVPATGLMRVESDGEAATWMETFPAARRLLDRAARGLKPFPAAKLRGAAAPAPERRTAAVVPASGGGDGGGGGSAPWLALAAAGAVLAVALVVLVRRRGGRLRPS
jgi:hypothetical protein